jgi:hypothetical protein
MLSGLWNPSTDGAFNFYPSLATGCDLWMGAVDPRCALQHLGRGASQGEA